MTRNGLIAIIVAVVAVIAVATAIVVVNNNNSSEPTTNECTVTWNYNYEGAESDVEKYKQGTKLPEYTPLRKNYVSTGWFYDKDLTIQVAFPYKVTESITLYAGWELFDMDKYLNPDFASTPFGQYMSLMNEKTVSSAVMEVEGQPVSVQFTSNGGSHMVLYNEDTDEYVVYGFMNDEVLFKFPADGVRSVRSYSITECNHEFISVKTDEGYTTYDLAKETGVKEGFSSVAEPKIYFNSFLMLDNKCYVFEPVTIDSKVYYKLTYDFTATSTCRPDNGSGYTYCEIEGEKDEFGNIVKPEAVHILDSEFNILYKYPVPESAVHCVCLYLTGESYLFQYALKANDQGTDDFSFSEDGVKYKLVSRIINANNGKSTIAADITVPAYTAIYKNHLYNFEQIFSLDIRNVICFYKLDSNKELQTNGRLLVSLNADGTVYKTFGITKGNSTFALIFPTLFAERYFIWNVEIDDKGSVSTTKSLVDSKMNPVLTGIATINCDKYFILGTEKTIYDGNGNVIGSFEGKEYAGGTNNLLFFTENNDLYIFDGTMKKATGYMGDLVCCKSYYGFKTGEKEYSFFLEDGDLIVKAVNKETRNIDVLDGRHMAEFAIGYDSSENLIHRAYILN